MLYDIGIPLALGLAMFLFGMKVMELALHQWAGPYLKNVLERFTSTPWKGMLTGTVSTALLQSSSAITVITIGLVNAGMMTFPRTLGVILGTNIGTCITTELISLKWNQIVLPMFLISSGIWVVCWLLPKKWSHASSVVGKSIVALRFASLAVSGFSCVLLGINVMQTITPALEARGLLHWFVEQSQRSLLWGVLAGAAVTALIHSSAATIAMTMGLASVNAIPVELGIAIILGANVGTCATALLASVGGSRYGQYVAWSHVLLNVGGAVLFLPLIGLLYGLSAAFTSDPAGQIAHAQTLFNIICSIIALPICYLPRLNPVKV